VVHGPFPCPSLMGAGRQLGELGVRFVGGGLVPAGQEWGLTPDVTGQVWRLGERRSRARFVVLGWREGSRVERRCSGASP